MAKFKFEPVEDYPYFLIGMNTGLSNHKLCWEINKIADINLGRVDDVEVIGKTGDSTFHAVYVYEEPENGRTFRLVQNKVIGGIFLPEIREADLVLVIDESPPVDPDFILKSLRGIQRMILAFEIEVDKLKHKQNLLLIA